MSHQSRRIFWEVSIDKEVNKSEASQIEAMIGETHAASGTGRTTMRLAASGRSLAPAVSCLDSKSSHRRNTPCSSEHHRHRRTQEGSEDTVRRRKITAAYRWISASHQDGRHTGATPTLREPEGEDQ